MSTDLKVVLTGIVLILSAIFFMGICIFSDGAFLDGHCVGLSLALFVIGLIVSVIGLFFCSGKKENEVEEKQEKELEDTY